MYTVWLYLKEVNLPITEKFEIISLAELFYITLINNIILSVHFVMTRFSFFTKQLTTSSLSQLHPIFQLRTNFLISIWRYRRNPSPLLTSSDVWKDSTSTAYCYCAAPLILKDWTYHSTPQNCCCGLILSLCLILLAERENNENNCSIWLKNWNSEISRHSFPASLSFAI